METIMGDKYNRLANTRKILTPQEIEEGWIQEPDYFKVAKLDGYVWDALFWPENMKKAVANMIQIDHEWNNMIRKKTTYEEKIAFIKSKTGIDVKIDEKGKWVLTGFRNSIGHFDGSDWLFVSGDLVGDNVRRVLLNRGGSVVGRYYASGARLCLLADTRKT